MMRGKTAQEAQPQGGPRLCMPPAEDALPQGMEGLTTAQAEALAREGKCNRMPKQRERGLGTILRKNILTLFNLLNLALALLLLWVKSYRNMLFLGVVVSNTLIGTVQELRAKRTHDRLLLLAEGKVTALRDGVICQLPPGDLVLGDVVHLGRGAQVPADGLVLEGYGAVNESLLTGESDPVPKAPGNELKAGSFFTEGAAWVRLTAVGADSYGGQLQLSARRVKQPRSELMESLQWLIRRVSIAIVPLGLLLYAKQYLTIHMNQYDAVTKTVAAVLGMIPEGLVLLTSVALAVGVVRLGKQGALVNELFGIESLARTDVVCMDKTGTLTSGAMEVAEVLPMEGVTGEQVAAWLGALLFAQPEDSPTQNALSQAFPPKRAQVVACVPFSSSRKWSAVQFQEAELGTLVLGAPDRVLGRETLAAEKARSLAEKGMRVLALAQGKALPEGDTLPQGLQPLALLALVDTLRQDVRETVAYFGRQGVTLKVLSGDHPLTVQSIARQAGLPGAKQAVDLSTAQRPLDYDALCQSYTIFGRVCPEDKMQLLHALKKQGHVVAMVGDGANDIPALKAADCSIAMAGGSDAAGRMAQMTLLSGNFAAMPHIVLEGRRVVNNITRAASLFLVKNIYSFLLAASFLLLPFPYPFAPIQMTLVSSLTVGIPSFVLALQPNRQRIKGQFMRNVLMGALPGGLSVWLLTLGICLLSGPLAITHQQGSTLCTLLAGYTGLLVLFLACLPLNRLRTALVVGVALAFGAAVAWFSQVFYLVPLTGGGLWVAVGLAVATPLCLLGLRLLVRRLLGREAGHPHPATEA